MSDQRLKVTAEPWDWPLLGPADAAGVALLVIDIQGDFVRPNGWFGSMGFDLTAIGRAVDVVANLLAAARNGTRVHVVHTRQGNAPDLSDLPAVKKGQGGRFGFPIGRPGPLGRGLIRGQEGWGIIAEVAPLPDERVVDKPGFSAFVGTDLDEWLRSRGIGSLIVTGVTANVCVLSTLLGAVDRGYDCLVVTDAIAGADPGTAATVCDLVRYQGGLFGCLAPAANVEAALNELADRRT